MKIGSFLEKNKIREYITKNRMLEKGNGVVLGLSGGPDSVCLFFVMFELCKEYNLTLKAVHINHMIRGEDADEDEAYVKSLCKEYSVALESFKIDVPALVAVSKRSVEEEARIARYSAFERVAKDLEEEIKAPVKIAIAHNADDNAETVLFHMARGAGLDGICGIAPVRENIIRPILCVPKSEIMAFLEEEGIDYCIDATNAEVDYDRNRIRHNIMPELTKVNDRALEHISNMTEHLSKIQDFINMEAKGLLMIAKDGDSLRKGALLTAPEVLREAAIKIYLSKYMPDEKDVSMTHIEAALALLGEDGEKYVDLPHKKRLVISYDKIFVLDMEENAQMNDGIKGEFSIKEISYEQGMEYPKSAYTKWFDCDKMSGEIVIRTRAEGDFLTINSDGGTKALKDYFINEKVPAHLRDRIPLVCDGSHVIWVVGYRISEYYKITNETTRVLEISFTEEK